MKLRCAAKFSRQRKERHGTGKSFQYFCDGLYGQYPRQAVGASGREGGLRSDFKNGSCFLIKGMMDFDPFDKETMIKTAYAIKKTPSFRSARSDNASEKRVELHCHTKMSDMDGVSSAGDILKQVYNFGQKAIAITDHGVVQAFPEALHTFGDKHGIPKDADLKVIYGMEAYLVDDTKSLVNGPMTKSVKDPIVIFLQ